MIAGPLPPEEVAAFLARCRAEDAAAGLPDHITNPDVLDRIAAIVFDGHDLNPRNT